jgi:hypothetical protein
MRSVNLALLLMCASAAAAQDDGVQMETVEVTGSRVSYRDLLDTPAIAIVKPGDYLVQKFTIFNDTRDAQARRREIHETILAIVKSAGRNFKLQQGAEFRATLDADNYRLIDIEDDPKRPDSSLVTLFVRAELTVGGASANTMIDGIDGLLRDAKAIGRSEIKPVDGAGLGMNKPERYRYELIAEIARDSRKILDTMALDCKFELKGLNTRIEWQRVSAGDLLLYIPYTMTISDCRERADGAQ